MSHTKNFFKAKREWSRVKDSLLASYLPLYFAKVLHTRKRIVYVDCFSGPGRFESGEEGSPLIAIRERAKAILHSSAQDARIDMYFIEPVYHEELRDNLRQATAGMQFGKTEVIQGRYEEVVPELMRTLGDVNLFLYVDPFGISELANNIFNDACRNFGGNVELLINLNSFGFIRECCRVLKMPCEIVDDVDRDAGLLDDQRQCSEAKLTAIARGDYWRDIMKRYGCCDGSGHNKDTLAAEREFSWRYKLNLMNPFGPFRYVLDLPIRIKEGSYPKYRMVYATNHPAGCVAMADNMISRANELYVDIQNGGQNSFFFLDVNQQFIDVDQIREHIIAILREMTRGGEIITVGGFRFKLPPEGFAVNLASLCAKFFAYHGVVCSSSDIKSVLKTLEKTGVIKVKRNPSLTKYGKPSTFWTEDSRHTVSISIKV